MNVLLKRTKHGELAYQLSSAELKTRLADGTIKAKDPFHPNIFIECDAPVEPEESQTYTTAKLSSSAVTEPKIQHTRDDPQTYHTRDLVSEPARRRGRPRKVVDTDE